MMSFKMMFADNKVNEAVASISPTMYKTALSMLDCVHDNAFELSLCDTYIYREKQRTAGM